MNTLCAGAIATVTVVAVLILRSPLEWMWTAALSVAMIVACIVFCRTLWASAIRNIVTYERNLVLLVASSIGLAPPATGSSKP